MTSAHCGAPVLHRFCARQHELLVEIKHLKLELVTLCLAFCAQARVLRGKFAAACALRQVSASVRSHQSITTAVTTAPHK